ncbi:MAG TPA: hypothetical protein PLQ76_04305 [bacterium]|nr:hypothetical protein [bacterium]
MSKNLYRKMLVKGREGSIILMAVFIVIFIAALMITVEIMRLSDLEMVTNQIEEMQAYYCAESCVEYSIWQTRLNINSPATNFSQTVNFPSMNCVLCVGGCSVTTGWTCSATVQNAKADSNPLFTYYNILYITGTGQTTHFTKQVRADVRRVILSTTTPNYQQILRWREL